MIAIQNALRQTGLLVAIMGGLAYYFISQMSIFTTIYNNIKYNYIIVQWLHNRGSWTPTAQNVADAQDTNHLYTDYYGLIIF